MGKSKHRKWYDEYDTEYDNNDRKLKERRKQKKIKSAIRSQDIDSLVYPEE